MEPCAYLSRLFKRLMTAHHNRRLSELQNPIFNLPEESTNMPGLASWLASLTGPEADESYTFTVIDDVRLSESTYDVSESKGVEKYHTLADAEQHAGLSDSDWMACLIGHQDVLYSIDDIM